MIQRRAPATIAPPFYHRGSTFVNPLFVFFLAVGKIFPGPAKNRNLIMGPPDFQGLFFGIYPTAFVDVIDAVGEPDPAVTAICLNRINGFSGSCNFDALGGNLPACFIGDWLAVFQGKTVVISQLFDTPDINHVFPFQISWGRQVLYLPRICQLNASSSIIMRTSYARSQSPYDRPATSYKVVTTPRI